MAVEIERRFLVPDPVALLRGAAGVRIEQGYLAFGEHGSEVRVRRAGDVSTLTVKRGLGLVREEYEVDLSPEQFRDLWVATVGRRLEKTRFRAPGPLPLEIDVYGGALAGLSVAEIEFASEYESRRFVPPAWCGREITADERFRNHSIVVLSAADLGALLNE